MGQLFSGGTTRLASMRDLEAYARMREQQAKQPLPLLYSRRNPHEFLFIALFDGTGQDVHDPKQRPTNIGELQEQAKRLKSASGGRIGYAYAEGIGTQKNPITRLVDGAIAYTWDDKIQRMYQDLVNQTMEWIVRDPEAQVRLVEVGYSR